MKTWFKRSMSILLALLMVFTTVPLTEIKVEAASNIIINGVDIGYASGSYFTKNGGACGTCHGNGICEDSTSSWCNCMRYWPTGKKDSYQVDLAGVQCFGYARYCQWKVYGSYATGESSTYTNLTGALNASACTESKLKSVLLNCAPATHIRMPSPHSVVVISTTNNNITFTDCNADNKCGIRVVTYTWSEFAAYIQRKGGISFAYARKGSTPPPEPIIDYPVPFIANTLWWWNTSNGKTPVYSSVGGAQSGYIYNGYNNEDDNCTIKEVYSNGWCKVYVPGLGDRYCELGVFVRQPTDYKIWTATTISTGEIYRRSDHGSRWGTLNAGSFVYVVSISEAGNMYQVIYTSPSGYECRWIDCCLVKHNLTSSVTAPTCTSQGYTTHTCTICGYSYKSNYTNAKGHSYAYKATKAPTTTATGTLTGTCSRCSGTTTVTLPKLNTTDYNYTVTKAATCTATGVGRYTWKTTSYGSFYFDVTLSKLGHNYTNYKVTTAPTTTASGVLTGTCSRCSGTTTVTLPKLNTTDYTYSVVKAPGSGIAGIGRYTWKTTTYGTFYFDVTLSPTDYAISYNANGGSGAPSSQTKTHGTALTLSSTVPTRFGYNFIGWATSPSATSANYQPGSSYTSDSNITLYAVWKQNTISTTTENYEVARINYPGKGIYYKFIPSVTTSYCMYAVDESDNYVELYDANGNRLAYDDDGGGDRQFELCHTLTAGQTYYIYVRLYSSSTTGVSGWMLARGYSISYDANGGSGAPSRDYNYYGRGPYIVSSTKPTRSGYTFLGWSNSSTATSAAYQPGGSFTVNADTSLYAVWKKGCENNAHAYTYKVTTTPTTTATGVLTGTCSRCSGTTTVTLPKLNTTDYNYAVTKAATCTATGVGRYTWKTTSYGSFYFDVTLSALGHSYNNYKVTTAPTTTATGILTGTCSRCSGTTTVTLPKLNTTDYNYTVTKEPTCATTGTGRYTWKTTSYGSFYFDVTLPKLVHNYTNYKVTTAPTTTATGILTGTCSRCSGTTTVTLPKLNTTDYNYTVTKAATCTATGTGRYTWKTTSYGSFYFDVTLSKLGHNYTNYKVTTAPTTTATGILTGTCSRCSGTTTVTLPKLNTTDYNYAVTKAATCTATGVGRYTWKTTSYGSFYFDVTLPKLGHNYTNYKVTTTPTTTATGVLTGTCSRCSGTATVTLPKLNTTDYNYTVTKEPTCATTGTGRYTWKTTSYGSFYFDVTLPWTGHDYENKVTAPTCTAQGYTTHSCRKCGDVYKDAYTAALGHNYAYKVTTAPTTSATGILTGTCSRCSGATTVTLPKLNTTDYNYTVTKAATCTATGTGRYTWKTTSYGSFYFDVTLSALGHSYNNYKVTKTPTTTTTGTLTRTCSRCSSATTVTLPKLNTTDYNYAVTKAATCTATGTCRYTWKTTSYGSFYFDVTLAATGHTTVIDLAVEPTCIDAGLTEGAHCGTCGEVLIAQEYLEPLGDAGHEYVGAICGYCGDIRLTAPVVTASNTASSGKIKLTWDAVEGAESYKIYRATSKTGTYSLMKTTTSTSYTNTSVAVGKTYYYYVVAVCDDLTAKSAVVARTCDLPYTTVTATNTASSGKVKLSWTKVDGAVKYEVYRATSKSGTYSLLKSTTATSYTDSSAKAGTTYYYKVKALAEKSAANSAYSSVVSRTCDLPQPVVTAANVTSSGKVRVSWDEIDGAAKYEIYRATSKSGTYSLIKTTTAESYTDTSAKAGKQYYYKVKAIAEKSAANSAYSSAVVRTCDLAQVSLTVSGVESSGKPKLSWDKVTDAKEYKVYRATSKDGTYTCIKTTTSTSYTDSSAKAGTKYYYKVRAISSNTSAHGAYSSSIARTCDLARPTASIKLSSGKPKVSWSAIDGAVEYKIYRATSKSGTYSLVKTTTSKSYTDSSAKKNTTYYYKVIAVAKNTAANSAYSSVVSIKATK